MSSLESTTVSNLLTKNIKKKKKKELLESLAKSNFFDSPGVRGDTSNATDIIPPHSEYPNFEISVFATNVSTNTYTLDEDGSSSFDDSSSSGDDNLDSKSSKKTEFFRQRKHSQAFTLVSTHRSIDFSDSILKKFI